MSTDGGEDDQGSSTTAVKIQVRGLQGWSVWDDGVYSTVKGIRINHDEDYIRSSQIEYIDKDGEPTWGCPHGDDTDRSTSTTVDLDCQNEYLTSIHGYYDDDEGYGEDGIKSMTFETNTKTWGPYGEERGTKFSFPIMGAKIVGFHGQVWWRLMAIGVYVQPITKRSMPMPRPKPNPQPQPQLLPQPEPFSLELYGLGREDGEYWVEIFRAIKRLLIYSSNKEGIISIQMEYEDENGEPVMSKKHGGDGGYLSEVIPNQVLNLFLKMSQLALFTVVM